MRRVGNMAIAAGGLAGLLLMAAADRPQQPAAPPGGTGVSPVLVEPKEPPPADTPDAPAPQSRPADSARSTPEGRLWAEIVALRDQAQRGEPFEASFEAAQEQRRRLVDRTQLYLRLYPGGEHRDEAIALELQSLFELACLESGEFEPLRRRVAVYRENPPSPAALHEAAYWELLERSMQRRTASQPASLPSGELDEALAEDYRNYIEAHPASRHTPRIATLLFDQAARVDDRAKMETIVRRMESAWPSHGQTEMLRGRLRRREAVGEPVRFSLQTADGQTLDTHSWLGRPVVVVVWASFDAASVEAACAVGEAAAGPQGVAVLGVSLDYSREELERGCERAGLEFPQAFDGLGWGGGFARHWGVREIPKVFVIDRGGRLLGVRGDEGWRDLLRAAIEN